MGQVSSQDRVVKPRAAGGARTAGPAGGAAGLCIKLFLWSSKDRSLRIEFFPVARFARTSAELGRLFRENVVPVLCGDVFFLQE
jgi:hypothetical protein